MFFADIYPNITYFVQIFVYLCNVSIEIDESSYYKYL